MPGARSKLPGDTPTATSGSEPWPQPKRFGFTGFGFRGFGLRGLGFRVLWFRV